VSRWSRNRRPAFTVRLVVSLLSAGQALKAASEDCATPFVGNDGAVVRRGSRRSASAADSAGAARKTRESSQEDGPTALIIFVRNQVKLQSQVKSVSHVAVPHAHSTSHTPTQKSFLTHTSWRQHFGRHTASSHSLYGNQLCCPWAMCGALQRCCLRPESKGLSLVTIVEFSIRSSIVIGIRECVAFRVRNHKTQ